VSDNVSNPETGFDHNVDVRIPWDQWRRQVFAIAKIELRRNLLGRRSLLLYFFASLPLIAVLMLLFGTAAFGLPEPLAELGPTAVFASGVFDGYPGMILRVSLYLGCVWVFMNLFRGEVLDRSLHYYFLAPVRREVLVAGKFLSGWIASTLLYGFVTAASFVLLHLAFGAAELQRQLTGPGLGNLLGYLVVTALGCLGYGAVFVLVGLFFKNPIVPALLIWGWEWINYLLPSALKKISVIHYLQSLSPVPVSQGPLAILADPTPIWIALPGLLIFSAIVLLLSGWRIRKMEIEYAGD